MIGIDGGRERESGNSLHLARLDYIRILVIFCLPNEFMKEVHFHTPDNNYSLFSPYFFFNQRNMVGYD